MQKGTIVGFSGSWGIGIGYLEIKKSDGLVESIPCDNAPTVRALDAAYGNVITEAHTVNQEAIKGKEIYYSVSGGLLEGFTPAEEATDELVNQYNKEHPLSKRKLKKVY